MQVLYLWKFFISFLKNSLYNDIMVLLIIYNFDKYKLLNSHINMSITRFNWFGIINYTEPYMNKYGNNMQNSNKKKLCFHANAFNS